MTTRTYNQELPRPYGKSIGLRLLSALESTGIDPFTSSLAVQESAALGLTQRHTVSILHRLVAAQWLTRVKKGVYAINDPVTKAPRAHPFAIGTALVTPSTVSHWSALQHWGLTDQIPVTVTLSSSRRTFPPAYDSQHTRSRPAWIVAGTRYEVIAITKARFFGISQVWVNERNQVPIFDRERALLDAFHHFHVFGSLSVALEILENHLADIDLTRLVRYARQLSVAAVVKRIGWALERLEASPEVLAPLLTYRSKGDTPLDPGRPARGHHNPTWHVIENLRDG
ncbi:MAG: hypothetical protein O3A47_02335 [Chloroflexi bacterium]|nr:hypothetical protein [Chloroflexota bacterium]